MASKMDSGSDEMMSEINITPFVDVMLVLLVIFMISAPAVYSNVVKIKTPTIKNAEVMPAQTHITVRIDVVSVDEIQVEGKKLTQQGLTSFVKKVVAADSRADVIVSADGALSHSAVLEVVDRVKEAGVENISFGVQKKI